MKILDETGRSGPNGYLESIGKGTRGVSRFRGIYYGSGDRAAEIARLKNEIDTANAIVVGAGAGLSTSAGFTYSGERFNRYFFDFAEKFGITDMYSGGFYPFPDAEIYAEDGTRMRSKGECIWYNLLRKRGILFRYDCAVTFVDQYGKRKTWYPDFMILCFDGTIILIEHLGGMGDLSYAMDFGEKSYWYFQEGFILGKNYFVTSDDLNYGTDSQMIARHVDRIEEMFYGF